MTALQLTHHFHSINFNSINPILKINVQCVKVLMAPCLLLLSVCKYDVWNHRTGKPMTLQALSAGTNLALCGVAPVAAHYPVLKRKTATQNLR